ncbi:MAG: hypothetical protein V3V99_00230 [candidate division Zixibacteria bacterium]
MPEVSSVKKCSVFLLYTEIGRGHPTYLDGIIEILETKYPDIKYHRTDVFTLSSGMSLLFWKIIRTIYYLGARGGIISRIYNMLRNNLKPGKGNTFLSRILGKKIIERLKDFSGLVIVAHPILAQILSPRFNVVYQHGELVVPDEAIVKNCRKIIVPLQFTADKFTNAGVRSNNITIVGQCIENRLISCLRTTIESRLERLRNTNKFHAAIFSSGAHPSAHINKIILIAESLLNHGHDVIIFTGNSRKFRYRLANHFKRADIEFSDSLNIESNLKILYSENRDIENETTARMFPHIDFFVAPAHERTNWGTGLGIPHFILCPHYGSFAPLNAEFALEQGVAYEIKDNVTARNFNQLVNDFRNNSDLERMINNGLGRYENSGFSQAARIISSMIKSQDL